MIPYTSCLCFGRKQWQPINDDDEGEPSVSDLYLSLGLSVYVFGAFASVCVQKYTNPFILILVSLHKCARLGS